MIVGLKGKVSHKEPTFVHVETVNGITYKIIISLFTSSNLKSGDEVALKTTQIFREDAQILFGFLSDNEQKMFETLIKINGVGPTTAMAFCSTLTPEDFATALVKNDAQTLKTVPGIGPKSAKRILVELSDYALNFDQASNQSYQEALLALESLGFKKERVKKALLECKAKDTATLVKEALKKLT